MKTVKETKYVFFCDKCEAWYDSNDIVETCGWCNGPVRELEGEERSEFYWKIAKTGYKVIPLEKQRKRYGKEINPF